MGATMSHDEEPSRCQNCSAALSGPFCSACGQKTGHLHRPIWEIAEDFLHTIVHFDGRLWMTLRSLFLRPGEMTLNWADGRQARYVPPIRLFIFTSLILVITLTLSDVTLLRITPNSKGPAAAVLSDGSVIVPGISLDVLTLAPDTPADPIVDDARLKQILDGNGGVQDTDDARLATRISGGLNALAADPRLSNQVIGKSLSRFMLLAVPVMAVILWLFYRRRFLAEHVVFALNTHTFFFIGLLMAVFLVWISRGLIPGGWLLALLWTGYSVHFLVALKRMYQQSWAATILKSMVITGTYTAALLVMGVFLLVNFLKA